MTGVALQGAAIQLNALVGNVIPIVAASAPGSGSLGQYWINTSSGNAINIWDGTGWVLAPTAYYLTLLTADPTGLTTISALTEVADTNYARQQTTFSGASTSAVPATASNSAIVTFGGVSGFAANMPLPAQWAALVSVSTGTSGLLLGTWTLNQPQQVLATQTINIAVGEIIVTTS